MIEETLEQKTQQKQPTISNTVLSAKRKAVFTPARFSVRGLRKHQGIQVGRNPRVIG